MKTHTFQNILLVNPRVPRNTYWSFHYSLRLTNKKCAMPPLGLISIAAYIPEEYNVRLVDMSIQELPDEAIEWADVVFLTGMLVQKKSFQEVTDRCVQFGKKVVAGGSYVTSSHEEIENVDHFVLGEVEDTFESFFTDLVNGNAKRIYKTSDFPDLRNTRPPRFDLLDMNAYSSMTIQYSRGCPFKCEFCDIWSVLGNKPRLKPVEMVLKELDVLYELGWQGALFIVDDNFIGNKNRAKKELLPALIQWQENHGYPFRFFTEASINLADDHELLASMRSAGFNEVFIGIETPSTEALKETGKSQNLRTDLKLAVKAIQTHGIEVMAGFIIGFDTDTPEVANSQINFIQETGIPQAMIGLLNALPGTMLHQRLEREGRLLAASEGNNTQLTTNFKTVMSTEQLKTAYTKILSTIYDSNLKNYFKRCDVLLDNIGHTPHFQRRIRMAEFLTFLRSLARQSFTRYSFQYYKFLIRRLFKNTSTFGEAVRFAVIGHHLYVITRQTLRAEKISLELETYYQQLKQQILRQSALLLTDSKEAIAVLKKIWKEKGHFSNAIRRKMNHIPLDFRVDVQKQLNDFERRFREQLSSFDIDSAKLALVKK